MCIRDRCIYPAPATSDNIHPPHPRMRRYSQSCRNTQATTWLRWTHLKRICESAQGRRRPQGSDREWLPRESDVVPSARFLELRKQVISRSTKRAATRVQMRNVGDRCLTPRLTGPTLQKIHTRSNMCSTQALTRLKKPDLLL